MSKRINRCHRYFCDIILNDLQNYNVWVAGGAIRSWFALENTTDIDLFFPSEKEKNKALEHLKGLGGEVIFENDNVTKVKYKSKVIDFCKVYYKDPEDTINNFDFTVSMGACDKKNTYFGDDFFMDLASRRLAINATPYPMSSLYRLQKYIKKGYWMCKEEMIKFTAVLQGVDLTQFQLTPEAENNDNEPESESGQSFPGMDQGCIIAYEYEKKKTEILANCADICRETLTDEII